MKNRLKAALKRCWKGIAMTTPTVCVISGTAMVSCGAGMYSRPAGWITGGFFCVAIGLLMMLGGDKDG